jgi:hypothetical protein
VVGGAVFGATAADGAVRRIVPTIGGDPIDVRKDFGYVLKRYPLLEVADGSVNYVHLKVTLGAAVTLVSSSAKSYIISAAEVVAGAVEHPPDTALVRYLALARVDCTAKPYTWKMLREGDVDMADIGEAVTEPGGAAEDCTLWRRTYDPENELVTIGRGCVIAQASSSNQVQIPTAEFQAWITAPFEELVWAQGDNYYWLRVTYASRDEFIGELEPPAPIDNHSSHQIMAHVAKANTSPPPAWLEDMADYQVWVPLGERNYHIGSAGDIELLRTATPAPPSADAETQKCRMIGYLDHAGATNADCWFEDGAIDMRIHGHVYEVVTSPSRLLSGPG